MESTTLLKSSRGKSVQSATAGQGPARTNITSGVRAFLVLAGLALSVVLRIEDMVFASNRMSETSRRNSTCV